ncbi:hypothetical protein GGX14DRAFT_173710 [Mycena pura]|uniref:DUF3074 domain-containing protein n=1 Tax=Mycena pura TaxID=153505 RepID=A0AAD6V0N1_9AGAR|nr:hypothetical protein GGX14DRAFT_173710 [Mycena pura]
MDAVTLDLTPRRPSEIPSDGAIISAAKSLIKDSLSWKLGKVYQNGLVQVAHAVHPDNSSWHSRVSRHTLPFDQFWAVLGHQWMPAKKAFNEKYIHEIKKVTLVKTLSQTASIWTILYGFPPPMSSRIFTILQVTHLDTSEPRTGWVVHLPVDLTGPGDEALLALEEHGIKGRYTCVEQIMELPDGRTEWRLVTSSTPAGSIPKSLAEKTLPARISLDVTSFIDWYYTCYLKPKTIEKDTTQGGSGYSLATVGCSLAVLNVFVYVVLYRTALAPIFPARTALAAIWGPGKPTQR